MRQDTIQPSSADWTDTVKTYLTHLLHTERSPITIANYRRQLQAYQRWYENYAIMNGGELLDPSDEDLRIYKAYLKDERKHKWTSINSALNALRSFYNWTATENLTRTVHAPKPLRIARAGPRWLTLPDQRRLLRTAEKQNRHHHAILTFLLRTGLRAQEFCDLTWTDVKISQRAGRATIRGKGQKERTIALSQDARTALETIRVFSKKQGPNIFQGLRGPSTKRNLELIVAKHARLTGIEHLTPHGLRHTCARRLVEAGMPLTFIADYLGHESLDTTRLYLASSDDDLQRTADCLDGPPE
jgi:integrase/recombinase XerC